MKFHRCSKCNGVNGKFVKICEYTGKPIETYKEHFERTVNDLKRNKNVVHIPGVHEH